MLLLLIGLWIACLLLAIASAALGGSGSFFGTPLKYLSQAIILYGIFRIAAAVLGLSSTPHAEDAKDKKSDES